MKREQPFRSARAIINILTLDRDNPILEAKLSERTLRRQLVRRGATSAQLLAEQRPKPYRRFERHAFGDLWQGDALHGPSPTNCAPLFCLPLSMTTPGWCPTPNSIGTSSCLAWRIAFKKPSGATACRWRFMWIAAQSTPPTSSTPPVPPSASSVLRSVATAYYPEGKGKNLS